MSKCKIEGCNKYSSYGYDVDNKYLRCALHKEDGMIDIKSKNRTTKCICGKNPFYGYKGQKPKFCAVCKDPNDPNLINVYEKTCNICSKIGYYTHLGTNLFYCIDHKEITMINYKKKNLQQKETYICVCGTKFNEKKYKINETDGNYSCYLCHIKNIPKKGYCHCGKRATFGITEATRCKEHIEVNMKDLKNVNKKCKCGSNIIMLYGIVGNKKASHCRKCKTPDMVDLNNYSSRCKCKVNLIALYGYVGDKKPSCCTFCKKDDMRNIRDPMCKNIEGLCQQAGNKKYKGYCTFCYSHLFPNDVLTKNISKKSKELKIRDFINEYYDDFIHDKPIIIGDGCDCNNRRRIDFRKIIGNTMLAIEVDEFQHKRYDPKDEEARYNDMMMVFSGKWFYIRYNPDTYRDVNNNIQNPNVYTRLAHLKKTIDKAINTILNDKNKEIITIEYIYYDENSKTLN